MNRCNPSFAFRGFALLIAAFVSTAACAQSNLLLNPGFESGTEFPDHWIAWGDGSYIWQTGDAHAGSRSMNLGGTTFALLYQRIPGSPGVPYVVRVWAKRFTPTATGTFKLEFHDAAQQILAQHPVTFTASDDWSEFTFAQTAPADTAYVTATVVGEAGGMVLFDDVSLSVANAEPATLGFDLTRPLHRFDGFGAMIWGYGSDDHYPGLLINRARALAELNIKYVRIENHAESATWPDMQATRAVTDALGIQWLYMIWSAPTNCVDAYGRLRDDRIGVFAAWWAAHVDDLYSHNIPVEYIELMNEPDSNGVWSTGITATQYNLLARQTRAALDAYDGDGGTNDLTGVGIAGPGLAAMDASPAYIAALDDAGVASLAAWSSHSWGIVDSCGPACIQYHWPNFGDAADARESDLPKFISEYATHETTFFGQTYPNADNYGSWNDQHVFPYYSVTNCLPYAVRVYGNTLALLNNGANAPFIWQLIDEPSEVNPPGYTGTLRKSWGLLDLWGQPKPIYDALRTLYPKIPIGASTLEPFETDGLLYAGAYLKDNHVVVGIANDSGVDRDALLHLSGSAHIEIVETLAFVPDHVGDPSIGDPDVGQIIERELTVSPAQEITISLPAVSTLTIVCDVAQIAGDLDLDGDVDLNDLAQLLGHYGTAGMDYRDGDVDHDGDVDLSDLAELLGNYGT